MPHRVGDRPIDPAEPMAIDTADEPLRVRNANH